MIWKALLLIYNELDVRLTTTGLRKRRFHHYLSLEAIEDAVESFRGFPDLVREFTFGAAAIEYEIKAIARPLTSLTERDENDFWPSPDDTRAELDQYAPARRHDSVFVLWPKHNFQNKTSVPGDASGFVLPQRDADGAEPHGYQCSPTASWTDYDRDLMRGMVVENGRRVGHSASGLAGIFRRFSRRRAITNWCQTYEKVPALTHSLRVLTFPST